MKGYVLILLALLAILIAPATWAGTHGYDYCLVTLERDDYAYVTLRDAIEHRVNGQLPGGCLVDSSNPDHVQASNVIWFKTPETYINPADAYGAVRYFRIERSEGGELLELQLNPYGHVMVGNPREDQDLGFVILDLTAFDETPDQTGLRCADTELGKVKLRNMAIASSRFDNLESFMSFSAHSCLEDAGGLHFCPGKIKVKEIISRPGEESHDHESYTNPNTSDDLEDWCEPARPCRNIEVFPDSDGDGFGDAGASPQLVCEDDIPAGYVRDSGDCNDSNPEINPRAREVCDGVDHNCDGDFYKNAELGAVSYFKDEDGDGYGFRENPRHFCPQSKIPDGYTHRVGDCDDTNPEVHRGAEDFCNEEGIDYNCDGKLLLPEEWFVDGDSDGYGDAGAATVTQCDQPAGHVANGDDCNDSESAINPAATEICDENLVDEDCDVLVNEDGCLAETNCSDGIDDEGDGFADCSDSDCADLPECVLTETLCEDGDDNDDDLLVDCDDPDCANWSSCTVTTLIEDCEDGDDNDGDLAVDCADVDCAEAEACIGADFDLDDTTSSGGCSLVASESSNTKDLGLWPFALMALAIWAGFRFRKDRCF